MLRQKTPSLSSTLFSLEEERPDPPLCPVAFSMREATFHVNRRTALQMAALALPFVLVNVWDIVATLQVLLHTATSANDTSDASIILMGTALVVAAGLSLLFPAVVLLLDWRRPPHGTTGRRLTMTGHEGTGFLLLFLTSQWLGMLVPRWMLLDCRSGARPRGRDDDDDDSHMAGHGGESGARRPLLDALWHVPAPAGTCETRGSSVTDSKRSFLGELEGFGEWLPLAS
jgi:hypothetical protein